jgi:hypothetical protein
MASTSGFPTIRTQLREAAGGRSERGAISGKSRLMIPHQSVAHCPGRLKTVERNAGTFDVGKVTGRPLDEDTQSTASPVFRSQQQPKA